MKWPQNQVSTVAKMVEQKLHCVSLKFSEAHCHRSDADHCQGSSGSVWDPAQIAGGHWKRLEVRPDTAAMSHWITMRCRNWCIVTLLYLVSLVTSTRFTPKYYDGWWTLVNITSIVGTTTLLLVNSCYFPEKKLNSHGKPFVVCLWARPEVWDEFQDKFNIPVVVELGDLGWPGMTLGWPGAEPGAWPWKSMGQWLGYPIFPYRSQDWIEDIDRCSRLGHNMIPSSKPTVCEPPFFTVNQLSENEAIPVPWGSMEPRKAMEPWWTSAGLDVSMFGGGEFVVDISWWGFKTNLYIWIHLDISRHIWIFLDNWIDEWWCIIYINYI